MSTDNGWIWEIKLATLVNPSLLPHRLHPRYSFPISPTLAHICSISHQSCPATNGSRGNMPVWHTGHGTQHSSPGRAGGNTKLNGVALRWIGASSHAAAATHLLKSQQPRLTLTLCLALRLLWRSYYLQLGTNANLLPGRGLSAWSCHCPTAVCNLQSGLGIGPSFWGRDGGVRRLVPSGNELITVVHMGKLGLMLDARPNPKLLLCTLGTFSC